MGDHSCETCGETPCDHVLEAIDQMDEQIQKLNMKWGESLRRVREMTYALEIIARGGYECDERDCTSLATRIEPNHKSVCGLHGTDESSIDFPIHLEEFQKIARDALSALQRSQAAKTTEEP